MPLVVNSNMASLIAQRNLSVNNINLNRSLERLSSGFRINKASDDAAGLTISEQLRSKIRGLKTALQNSQDGISILQIAEGSLSVINENFQRIRELTVQAANATNNRDQRAAIESEIKARLEDNDRIVQSTSFNGISLLTGSTTNARLQIGSDSGLSTDTLDIANALANAAATALGLLGATTSSGFTTTASILFSTGTVARKFLNDVDVALAAVSSRRALIGAFQNQLDSTIQNITLGIENFTSSESRIRDLDIASENAMLTRNQILQQASISVLSQANQTPQAVLRLLQ